MRRAILVVWFFAVAVAGCDRHPVQAPPPDAVDVQRLDATAQPLSLCSSCDAATQFCYQYAAGLQPASGCVDLPAVCRASSTCACVAANVPDLCPSAPYCTTDQEFAGVFVGCYLP